MLVLRVTRSASFIRSHLTSAGLIRADRIKMTQQRPFAWLRRFTLNSDGTTTLDTSPRDYEAFKRDLAEFSQEQSTALCATMHICNAIDAHHAAMHAPRDEIFTLYPNRDLYGGDIDDNGVPSPDLSACEFNCTSDTSMRRIYLSKTGNGGAS